jgi:hypothetical protein
VLIRHGSPTGTFIRLRLRALLRRWRGEAVCIHGGKVPCSWYLRRMGRRGFIFGSQRAGRYQNFRMILIDCGKLGAVRFGLPHVLNLGWKRGYAGFVQDGQFGRRGPYVESASTSHIAHSHVRDIGDLVVVDIVNNGDVDVVHRAVVSEPILVPISSFVAAAPVTEAVIDAAVVADMLTPISMVPLIATTPERPVRRRPKRANIGSNHPYAGHPVIAGGSVRPATGRPHVILAGTFGLAVLGNRRRRLFGRDRRFGGIGVAGVGVVVLIVRLVVGLIVVLICRRRRCLVGSFRWGLRWVRTSCLLNRRLWRGLRILGILAGGCEIGLRRIGSRVRHCGSLIWSLVATGGREAEERCQKCE